MLFRNNHTSMTVIVFVSCAVIFMYIKVILYIHNEENKMECQCAETFWFSGQRKMSERHTNRTVKARREKKIHKTSIDDVFLHTWIYVSNMRKSKNLAIRIVSGSIFFVII